MITRIPAQDYFRSIIRARKTKEIITGKTNNKILLQFILKINLMKNKISSITLIIAFLGITLLPACSRKVGCYYSIANDSYVPVLTQDTDAQTCIRNIPEITEASYCLQ